MSETTRGEAARRAAEVTERILARVAKPIHRQPTLEEIIRAEVEAEIAELLGHRADPGGRSTLAGGASPVIASRWLESHARQAAEIARLRSDLKEAAGLLNMIGPGVFADLLEPEDGWPQQWLARCDALLARIQTPEREEPADG